MPLESIYDEAKFILGQYLEDYESALTITWGVDRVFVSGPEFDVVMADASRWVVVYAGEHFCERLRDPEVAADCFMWLLTPVYRVLEQWKGDRCVAYAVERFESEWYLPDGFALYGNPSRVVEADRMVTRHQALILPPENYRKEFGEHLDERGVPLGSTLGTIEEPNVFRTDGHDTPFHNQAWDLLDALEGKSDFEQLAGDTWVSLIPYDREGYQITLDAEGQMPDPDWVVLLAGSAACSLPFREALRTAGRLANGFGRVVETYVGKWHRSSVIECYREEGWVPVSTPIYASWFMAPVLVPTRTRILQMRLNVVAQFVPGPKYRLGEDGLPPDSHLGERWV